MTDDTLITIIDGLVVIAGVIGALVILVALIGDPQLVISVVVFLLFLLGVSYAVGKVIHQ